MKTLVALTLVCLTFIDISSSFADTKSLCDQKCDLQKMLLEQNRSPIQSWAYAKRVPAIERVTAIVLKSNYSEIWSLGLRLLEFPIESNIDVIREKRLLSVDSGLL